MSETTRQDLQNEAQLLKKRIESEKGRFSPNYHYDPWSNEICRFPSLDERLTEVMTKLDNQSIWILKE